MARLDALLEILGPAWIAALGSDMTLTALRFLARYANPVQVKRLGKVPPGGVFPPLQPPGMGRRTRRRGHRSRRDHAAAVGSRRRRARLRRAGRRYRRRSPARADPDRRDQRVRQAHRRALRQGRPSRDRALGTRRRPRLRTPESSDDSATQHDSPTWPRSAPSPGWSRPPTPPAKPTATADRPRPAIAACARPCSSPPTTPARSTPPWPSATSGSCSPVSTTIPRSARWLRSCSPESPPVCAPAPTTYCATLTAASSPKPKDAPSSPNATPCHPRSVPPGARSPPHRHPRRNERNERAKTGVATRSKASPVPQPA